VSRPKSKGLSRTIISLLAIVVIAVAGIIAYMQFTAQPTTTTTPTSTSTTSTTVTTTTTTTPSTTTTTTPQTVTTTTIGLKKVVRIGIGIDADNLDPHAQTTTPIQNIVNFICEPLVWYNENGVLAPYLAESITTSEDGLQVTVVLKKGIKFQDGTEFNSQAVKFTFDRILNPNVKVPNRAQLEALNSTEVIDNYTIKFNLKKRFAPFISALSGWGIISPTTYQKLGEENIARNLYNLGTGPYKFKEWVKGDRIVLVKFDEYWKGVPKIDEVVFKIVPEAQTREAMLLAGDLDIAIAPPPPDVVKMNSTTGIIVYAADSTRYIYAGFNTQKEPFNNVKVRQALNYAVDKEAITKNVLFNLGSTVKGPFHQSMFGFSEQKPYEYNPDKAKQLLSEAGYPNGFKVKMMSPTGRYLFDRQVAEAIQSYLAKVGVTVELFTPDWPTFVSELMSKNATSTSWDIVLIGWAGNYPDADGALYATLHSSQWPPGKFNWAFYKNAEVDRLLDQGRIEPNPEQRAKIYAEAIKIIWEDCPDIWLYVQRYVVASSTKIHGLRFYPNEMFDIRSAYSD